jgi:hypothetical protein
MLLAISVLKPKKQSPICGSFPAVGGFLKARFPTGPLKGLNANQPIICAQCLAPLPPESPVGPDEAREVKNTELSPEEIKQLKRILSEKEK